MLKDLPFDVNKVMRAVQNRYDVEYAFAYGSAVRGKEDYADIDIYTVCDIDYSRTFEQFYIDDDMIDLVVHSPYTFMSYRDNYYWYPENLITMIGATFNHCEILHNHERYEQIRQDIAAPSSEVRFFIYTYHLGQLLQSRYKRDWADLWVNKPWSIIAVLSSYWDQYPSSVDTTEYRGTLSTKQKELLKPIWSDESFTPEITNKLIDQTYTQFFEWMEQVRRKNTIEIYMRTQRRAIEAIFERYPKRAPSEYQIMPANVG